MSELAAIWEEHKERLGRYVLHRTRRPDEVDDILQDIFLKAFENVHTLKSHGSMVPWLYRIASNAIADHFRTHRPTAELPEHVVAPSQDDDALTELARCVEPFIDELPHPYRQALRLVELEGRPQKDVARHLGLSYSGAKSRVQRGREHLRNRFLRCCVIETGRRGIVHWEPRR